MFIGRREDGTVYGCWSCRQPDDADHQGIEELRDDHPDVIAFLAPSKSDEIAAKRTAAVEALQKEQIMKRAADPDAPQAVKEYADALEVEEDAALESGPMKAST